MISRMPRERKVVSFPGNKLRNRVNPKLALQYLFLGDRYFDEATDSASGNIPIMIRKYEKAVANFIKALRHNPRDFESEKGLYNSCISLGNLHFDLAKSEKKDLVNKANAYHNAINCLEIARRINPDSLILGTLGVAHIELGWTKYKMSFRHDPEYIDYNDGKSWTEDNQIGIYYRKEARRLEGKTLLEP
ncbi:MAG: hypothetical protein Q8L47_00725 [bacterium]|nr:hypothetical protein [bacterium]